MNQSPVRASIIIVAYNSREHLIRGLPLLQASLTQRDECIIIDNASSDDTATWINENYPQFQIIVSPLNLGFGGGCNLGVQSAIGEFVVFLNPDTQVETGWLEPLIRDIQISTDEKLVTSRIVLLRDPSTINTCGNNVHVSGLTLCRGMGQTWDKFDLPAPVSAVSGAAFAMRREFFLKLDGFDKDIFMYMEDTDLSMRARLAGACCAFVPDSVIRHDYELHFGPDKTYFQERHRYLMLLKLYRWPTLFVLLPVFLLSELVTWGYVLLRESSRLGNKFRAYSWVVL